MRRKYLHLGCLPQNKMDFSSIWVNVANKYLKIKEINYRIVVNSLKSAHFSIGEYHLLNLLIFTNQLPTSAIAMMKVNINRG